MAYNLTLTNGTALASLADGSSDTTTTSINLIGKNFAGYGLYLNENFIKILENFASSTAPSNPLQGQLWWDTVNKHLSVYQGTVWKVISSSQTGTNPPVQPVVGDFWWDTGNSLFKVWSGSTWVAIGPSIPPGTAITTISGNTVTDSSSIAHIVGNVTVNNKLSAVISSDSTYFTPQNSISGLTRINPGINFPTAIEPTMISSPNMTVGVSGGNSYIQNTTVGTGFALQLNLAGTSTPVISVNGATGLATVIANPTANLGIATKQYTDVAITNAVSNAFGGGGGSGGTTTFNSNLAVNGRLTVAGNVLPSSNVTYNLGSTTAWWNNAYINTIVSGGSNAGLSITGSIVPTANLSYNLGSTTAWWNNIYGTAIHALYADLAERFEADSVYEPGTVVEIGGPAEITAATQDLSENVFGVISTNAAYLMNSSAGSDQTHPPIAVQGRVPVKVVGKIRKGDRLVSAGNGLARAGSRTEINTWNVIGRALENKLDNGVGTIEAVVKLNS
jgi:hypothetical protein